MKTRWIVSSVCAIPAAAAGYMAWTLWLADDGGKWLFTVFAGFFLALSIAPLMPPRRRQKEDAKIPTTRFAGAWVLPFYLILFGALLLLAIIARFFAGS